MTELNVVVEEQPQPEDVQVLKNGLIAYVEAHSEPRNFSDFAVWLRDAHNNIVGGAHAVVSLKWLYVDALWLADNLRGRGYGTQLMQAVEREAVRRGGRHAWLKTFSFQAVEFYKTLGYEVFGVLEDYPQGHANYFMKKMHLDVVVSERQAIDDGANTY